MVTEPKPQYLAVMLNSDGADLGPIEVGDAESDVDTANITMKRGAKWMAKCGVENASIQIVINGVRGRTIPIVKSNEPLAGLKAIE